MSIVAVALCYLIPFFASDFFWWLILLYPFMLYALMRRGLSYRQWLLFVCISVGVHALPVLYGIVALGTGSLFLRLLLVATAWLLLCAAASYPLVVSVRVSECIEPCGYKKIYLVCCIIVYHIFVAYWYPLSNPLLPLVAAYEPMRSCPVWAQDVRCVQRQFKARGDLVGMVDALCECCDQAAMLLMPESSLYEQHAVAVPALCARWARHGVVGGFRYDGGLYRNCVYYIQDGKLAAHFDKRHGVLLTEWLPWWLDYAWVRSLYFQTSPPIVPSGNERPRWRLRHDLIVVPYICSELFFSTFPDDHYNHVTVLALCNDRWAPAIVKRWMLLLARYRAITWQRDVVYVSYHYALLLGKSGIISNINKN